ncbi:hypothetical protein [Chryseobacterium echinoideorum]|uniref:hypothetical protein n=1 Tax=Chryseobacterium echinoideorum TaxID=1549648 RepID=UPI001E5701C8|nr:hypothetical protein [Chryseobacterium echinoideorum]
MTQCLKQSQLGSPNETLQRKYRFCFAHYSANRITAEGKISNKRDLRDYFSRALQKYPNLDFELYHELKEVNSSVLFYRSVNNSFSAEYMELNNERKASKVRVHYKFEH